MLVAVLFRVAIVLEFPQMPFVGDEIPYFQGARQLADGLDVGGFPFRPPLYIFFNAFIIELAGASADAIRLSQALLDGLGVVGMYALGVSMQGRAAGLWAAWIFALFPDFIGYSHYLWSESLANFVVIGALLLLRRLYDRPSWPAAVATGCALGLACLVKPYHLYLAPLLLSATVLCAAREARPRATKLAALAMLAAVVTIVPWSIRMTLKSHRPVIISTTGALNLKDGTNYYYPPQYDFPYAHNITPELVAALGREEGVVAFIASNPALFVSRAAEKMGYLWSPNSYVIRHLYNGKYGNPKGFEAWQRLTVSYAVMIATALVLLLAIPNFFASRGTFAFYVSAAYVVPYTLMITITPALSRYRLPMMIFAVLHAACFLAGANESLRTLASKAVWVPSVLLWAALGLAWSARLPEVVAALW